MGDASGENVGEAVDGSSAKAGMEGAFRESRFPPHLVTRQCMRVYRVM